MSKKSNKPKDPKKVAAGKARAAKALRTSTGKLQSNSFKEEVSKIAASAGFVPETTAGLQRYFEQNENIIEKYLGTGITSQNRYSIKTIQSTVKKTSKKTFIVEGEDEKQEASPEYISYKMAEFEQYCYTNRSCTGVAWKKQRTGTGEPIIKIPDLDFEDIDEMDDIEFIEYCAEFGVIVWISDLSKVKDKRKKDQRTKARDNKLKNAKTIKRDNAPTSRKRKRRTK